MSSSPKCPSCGEAAHCMNADILVAEYASTSVPTIVYRCFSCGAILGCVPAVISEMADATRGIEHRLRDIEFTAKTIKSRID